MKARMISVRLTPTAFAALEKAAQEAGLTRTAIVELAIREKVKRDEKVKEFLSTITVS